MKDKRRPDRLITVITSILLALLVIEWTPFLSPSQLLIIKLIIVLTFLFSIVLYILTVGEIIFPIKDLALLIGFYFPIIFHPNSGFFETRVLYLAIGTVALTYFINSSAGSKQLIIGFNLLFLVTVLTALFGLLCIFTGIPCPSPPVSYGAFIRQVGQTNLFGFSGEIAVRLFVPISIFVGGYFAYHAKSKWQTILYVTCLAVLGIFLVVLVHITGGHMRTSVFLLLSMVVMLIGRRSSFFTRYLPYIVMAPIPGYIFLYFVTMKFQMMAPMINNLNMFMSKRIYLYFISVEIVLEHPFGIGFGNLPQYARPIPGISMMSTVPNQAHNQFFIVLSETGVPGALGFIIMIYYVLSAARSVLQQHRLGNVQILAIICVALLFTGLSVGEGGPLYAAFYGLIWWLSAAGMLAERNQRNNY